MASVSKEPNGRRSIQFVAADGKRRTIRLGKVAQRIAEEIRGKVEALHVSKVAGISWDAETARWVAALGPDLADKLAAVGLVPPRKEVARTRLGEFLTAYIAGRTDVKEGTATNLRIGANRLIAYFGAARDLASVTAGDCDDWVIWLKERYAAATVGKTVKWGRQFFRAALRKKLIVENPFEDVKAPGMGNEARKFFVDRETSQRVLDACPDLQWRLIFALSRYGGLRCPSEHQALEWTDINWELNRFRVRALGADLPRVAALPRKGVRAGRRGRRACHHPAPLAEQEPAHATHADHPAGWVQAVATALPQPPRHPGNRTGRRLPAARRL